MTEPWSSPLHGRQAPAPADIRPLAYPDLPEVLAVSDRVVVVKEGRVSRVVDRAEVPRAPLMDMGAVWPRSELPAAP